MKTLCFTGHRKVPGRNYGEWQGVEAVIIDVIQAAYTNGFRNFICGGAIGFDTLAANAVLHVAKSYPDINLIIAVPSQDQAARWSMDLQNTYFSILSQANKVVYVDAELNLPNVGEYSKHKLFARNDYMVDQSSAVVACAANTFTGGGAYCIKYARGKGIPVLVVDPNTLTKQWIT